MSLPVESIGESALRILAVRVGGERVPDVSVEQVPALLLDPGVHIWVDISGTIDAQGLSLLRDTFKFHDLAIQDCIELSDHPKVENFGDYVFLTVHGLTAGSTAEKVSHVEIDVFLGRRFVVTSHQVSSRSVEAIWEVMRHNTGLLVRGPVHLLHAILERQVDGIETILDGIDGRVAELEERVIARSRDKDLGTLMALRRSILRLRRWMHKQRDVIGRLARNEFPLITPQEAPLFRDIYDHLQRFTDLLESYRELTTSVQDAYLTVVSNRLNEVMKFLTVFTAVLMPLTVITGIYGMNFQHMPELATRWGYPLALGAMFVTAGSLLWYFKRRGWLGRDTIRKR